MGFFRRRRETLNEQLLREAGLDEQSLREAELEPPPLDPPRSVLAKVGVPDGSRVEPKEWDAAVTVAAGGLAGDRVEFTTMPNGDLIVGDQAGDADLSPLADAVESHVTPPYRAVATRQDGDLWAVGAKRIRVAQVPFPDGDKLELTQHGDERELRVDSEQSDEVIPPELAQLGEAAGDNFYVDARRIDGDFWEVRVTAL